MSEQKLFVVKELRSYYATYLISAEDEEQAGHLNGDIQEESYSDCWGVKLVDTRARSRDESKKRKGATK